MEGLWSAKIPIFWATRSLPQRQNGEIREGISGRCSPAAGREGGSWIWRWRPTTELGRRRHGATMWSSFGDGMTRRSCSNRAAWRRGARGGSPWSGRGARRWWRFGVPGGGGRYAAPYSPAFGKRRPPGRRQRVLSKRCWPRGLRREVEDDPDVWVPHISEMRERGK
jgi:hypothetical protein